MNAPRLISLALFVGGIALIIFGINAAESFSSDISNFFTGSPTDEAIWMLIGGGECLSRPVVTERCAEVIDLRGLLKNAF